MKPINIKSRVWLYDGPGAWHFITLPKKESDRIKKLFVAHKRAWGSIPVMVKLKGVEWNTSIFPDRKLGAYVLPIKKTIRQETGVSDGDEVRLTLGVQ